MSENAMEICRNALRQYGAESQEMMMVEECAELIDALAKSRRGRIAPADVITEIADVQIVLWQMMILYGTATVNAEIDRKLQRLRNRIDGKDD